MFHDFYFKSYTINIDNNEIICQSINSITNPNTQSKYKIYLNGYELKNTTSVDRIFYYLLDKLFVNYGKIRIYIKNNIDNLPISDVNFKIDEFECIKNGKLDLISINSLYDYYGIIFSETEFSQYWNSIKL